MYKVLNFNYSDNINKEELKKAIDIEKLKGYEYLGNTITLNKNGIEVNVELMKDENS